MDKGIKTSFEEEQQKKEDAFLKLTPLERLAHAYKVRQQMHKPAWITHLPEKK